MHTKGCSASQARLLPVQLSVHSFPSWLASFKRAEELCWAALGIQRELDVVFPKHFSKSRLLQKVFK